MAEVNDEVLCGAVSKMIASNFSVALSKVTKRLLELSYKISETEKKLKITENEFEINSLSNETKGLREELLSLLIVKDKLNKLIEKNNFRLEVIKKNVDENQINAVSKKQIDGFLGNRIEDITLENLGISDSGIKYLLFKDKILKIKDGEIIFDDKENIETLSSLETQDFLVIFDLFPSIVNNVPDSLLITNLRLKLLKAVLSYVFENSKTQTFSKINKSFGEPLAFDKAVPSSYLDFTEEIINLYKVRIKNYLIQENQTQEKLISDEIDCDETSLMLPEKYRVQSQDEEDDENDVDAFIKKMLSSD